MSQIDISALKGAIKTIFDAANTTTASPVDLSNGMAQRVQNVFKVNPEKLPIQASLFPCVTIFIDNKSIAQDGIALNQVNARRKSEVDIKIMGSVWQNTYTDISTDDGDEEIEMLMENVEQILRNNPTLSNNVNWQLPTDCSYHTGILSEESHMRAGVLNLRAHIYY